MQTPSRLTRTSPRRSAFAAVLVLLALILSVLVIPAAEANEGRGGRGKPDPYVRGESALARISGRLPDVARSHGMQPGQLMRMLREDPTLHVDQASELLYLDVAAPASAESAPLSGFGSLPEAGTEFQLASLPGANKTVFLDFDGHATTNTTWNVQNAIATINSPAYDTDGNAAAFSASELQTIRTAWASVAEDFAPWNVNVTTIDPGVEALRRTSNADQAWGIRVVITADFLGCGCGGAAYPGSFGDFVDEPVFVFNRGYRGVAEAATHETGHAMLLAHDGLNGGTGYYRGHVTSGTIGWAPIMGASYFQAMTQWSQQEYIGANNSGGSGNFGFGGDDIAVISSLTNGNGFGLKVDDHGTDLDATNIVDATTTVEGLIETRTDRDGFAFDTAGGAASFIAYPAAVNPNLDIELTVRNDTGLVIASSNQADLTTARITTTLDAGRYLVEIAGVGVGDPGANPASGYSDYASLGRYTVQFDVEGFGAVDPTTTEIGDSNCDGQLTVLDAIAIAQYITLTRTPATACPLTDPGAQINVVQADANGDGYVDVFDAVTVSQCVALLNNALCP